MKNRNTYATYFFAFLLEKFYVFIGIYIYKHSIHEFPL